MCDQCGMIISDARFATATIVEGPRGAEPLLFDDFNCQINHETENDLTVVARWSHDYHDSRWLRSRDAHYLLSPELRTPMASHMAAFAAEADVKRMHEEIGGEIVSFDEMLNRAESDASVHAALEREAGGAIP